MSEQDDDGPGTVRWFGTSWRAPVCHPDAEVPVPVGELCIICSHPITASDTGVQIPWLGRDGKATYHLACFRGHLGIDDYLDDYT